MSVFLAATSHLFMGVIVPLAIVAPLAIALYQYRELPPEFKILTYYLVLGGVSNVVAKILAMKAINNLPLLHLYTAIEFIIVSFFYKEILKNERISKYINVLMILFLLFCVVNAIFFQNIFIYNSYSRSLSAFIIIFYAIFYFKSTLDQDVSLIARTNPLLWINAALLIYFGGAFFLFISANLILSNVLMNTLLWNIHATLVLTMYVLFTIGLSYAKGNR